MLANGPDGPSGSHDPTSTALASPASKSEGVELGEPVEIVRATARLRLDPRFVGRVFGKMSKTRVRELALAMGVDIAAWPDRESLEAELGRVERTSSPWKAMQRELYDAQRAVARAQNACIRALWQDDGLRLDTFVAQHEGRLPKNKEEWPPADLNLYQLARSVAPEIPGAMASVASRTAMQKWFSTRFDALILQTKSPPHFRDTCPVPLRAADVDVRPDGKDFILEFALREGRGQRWWARVQPRDRYQQRTLEAIAKGQWQHGNILIERDQRNRWHFRIAYKRLAPAPTRGKTAAINRGIRVFLACVTDAGDRWLYDGNDIVAFLKQVQERRKQYQRDAKAAARGGRGRKRILRPIQHLQDKAERWRATKCQTIARRVVRWLYDRGVRTLIVEDFQGIRQTDLENPYVVQLVQEWPYYQLEQRIRSCCAELGIEVVSRPAHFISQRCPKCGHTEEKNRDLRYWKLDCQKCSYRDHLDVAAATNNLQLPESKPSSSEKPKKNGKKKR